MFHNQFIIYIPVVFILNFFGIILGGYLPRNLPCKLNILLLLLKNKGKVFSIDQIYEKIWKEEAFCADNTVTVHIRHIREKIEIDPKNPRYLKVMWGIGYKVEDLDS